jgi:hypothetical protein
MATYLDDLFVRLTNRLAEASKKDFSVGNAYLGHSGGKDSCLVHALCKAAGLYLPIFHNAKLPSEKNGVHQATAEFLYILSSAETVTYIPSDSAPPAFFVTQIDGTRRDEAERADGRSTDLVVNGKNTNRAEMQMINDSGLFNRRFVYPLFDVSTEDVWALIEHLKIPISAEYEILGLVPKNKYVVERFV